MRKASTLRQEALTMRIPLKTQPTIRLQEVNTQEGRIQLRAELCLDLPLPEQDHHLPDTLESAIDDAGQRLKRLLFQQVLQEADRQLSLLHLSANPLLYRRRGTTGYTFKTVFGTVKVRRTRLQNKDTGITFQPACDAWLTPQQVCITDGLRHAAADALLTQSTQNALASVEANAGEPDLLSKSEVLNIVHQQGQELRQAALSRAEAALAEHPQARELLLPTVGPPQPEELNAAAEEAALTPEPDEESEAEAWPLGFTDSKLTAEAVAAEEPRCVDEGWVMVQPDGVITHAQAHTKRKQLQTYTAVVLLAGLTWHFAAATPGELIKEVAGLLAVLGVAEGKRRLLFLTDGARWMREWFEGLAVKDKAMLLCWYHLVKKVGQLLSLACRGRQHRGEIEQKVLQHLWLGRVEEALEVLKLARQQMKNPEALDELVGYLQARKPYLADYQARKQAGLWIASNRVEKFNDQAISARCKHQGMAWTEEGVEALARLQAARRNGELDLFRSQGELPSWHESQLVQAA